MDLAKVIAPVAALVTGVGALTLTGALGRVQRNHGTLFAVAVGLTILGAGIALVSTLISDKAKPIKHGDREFAWRESAQGIGAVLMIAGVIVGFVGAIITADDTERPTLKVKFDDETFALAATGTVSNLRSSERMGMVVDGVSGPPYRRERSLSWAYGGPNGDGDAKATLDVQIPPGRFDAIGVKAFTDEPQNCNYKKGGDGGTGCVVIPLPPRPDQPQITASWEGEGRTAEAVKLTVSMAHAAGGGKDTYLMGLNVVGVRGDRQVGMYRALIAAPVGGSASRTVRLPVDPHFRLVCAQAGTVRAGDRIPSVPCPLAKADPGLATAELHVPDP